MTDYHNEFDPYAAQWIRNLMAAGLIPKGEVDERSIADVSADDLRGFKRWHFFSGIGGWALALRLAGWPDDREIWTGSAPCQAFSVAGKGAGFDDPRDLWPHMFQFMRTIRPAVAMGEQVYAAVGKGWLDRVHADLESAGYAVGELGAPACAVNAPHRRDRLWWCAEDRAVVLGDMPGFGSATGFSGPVARDEGVAGIANNTGHTRGDARAWGYSTWIACHDGKARRVGLSESGIRRLADDGRLGRGSPVLRTGIDAEITPLLAQGVKSRVGKLRGFGNMIVPQLAAEMIGAYMDCRPLRQPATSHGWPLGDL